MMWQPGLAVEAEPSVRLINEGPRFSWPVSRAALIILAGELPPAKVNMSSKIRTLLALTTVAAVGCKPAANVGSPVPDASLSYVVQLGNDTVAVEQYHR